jgi:ribonuclease HI
MVVSDGSVKEGKGTYAWVLGTKKEICVEARGTAFGQKMSSNRAELCGILSWLLYMYHYTTCFKITMKCVLRPFCDNTSAVAAVNFEGEAKPKEKIKSDYDVIAEARATLKRLRPRMNINPVVHVKGHQDTKQSIDKLSREAQFNVKADELARVAMDEWRDLAIQGLM